MTPLTRLSQLGTCGGMLAHIVAPVKTPDYYPPENPLRYWTVYHPQTRAPTRHFYLLLIRQKPIIGLIITL